MKTNNSIHGMTSKQASNVKKKGHKREKERQYILSTNGIGSQIIKGTTKPDILRDDNLLESVKGGRKTQWYLFSVDKVLECDYFSDSEKSIFKKWGSCFDTPNLFCEEMCNTIKKDPHKWVNFFIGTQHFDLMVIKDYRDGKWYEFDSKDFVNKIMSNVNEIYYNGTKVVFKGGGANIWPEQKRKHGGVILMELDRRSSKKRSLFHSKIEYIIDCLK